MSSPRGRRTPSAVRRRLNRGGHTVKWAALRWLYRRDTADVGLKLGTEPFAPILDHYPEIPLKVVRPYLTVALRRGNRAVALVGHYAAAARLLCDAALVESHTGCLELVAVATSAGKVAVELTGQAASTGKRSGALSFVWITGRSLKWDWRSWTGRCCASRKRGRSF